MFAESQDCRANLLIFFFSARKADRIFVCSAGGVGAKKRRAVERRSEGGFAVGDAWVNGAVEVLARRITLGVLLDSEEERRERKKRVWRDGLWCQRYRHRH